VEIFQPDIDTWTVWTKMPGGPKVGVAAAVLGDKLYVVGGFNRDRPADIQIAADIERFDLISNT
jgi:N-acetylneuraminic acid mutarotase